MKTVVAFGGLISIVALALGAPAVYAATTANSQVTQQINSGTLSTDVRDGSNAVVASPSFAMTAVNVSTSQQTATGTFGSSTQRISVDNPGGAPNGWTLALNATTPGTGTWTSGGNTYAYNGSAATGQLTVDPSVATLTSVIGASTNITKGTSATFAGTTPITILTAANTASSVWNGYLTGVGLNQTIPAGQPGGSYSFSMTQTVTAQ